MWIYYYITHGPGHQGTKSGFHNFHSSYEVNDINDYLVNRFDYLYNSVLRFWKVDSLPIGYIEDEVKETKARVAVAKKYHKLLTSTMFFAPHEKVGSDKTLQKNIYNVVESVLLRQLHKAGFMYTDKDISDWRYGKKSITEPHRTKILRIIRRSEKY